MDEMIFQPAYSGNKIQFPKANASIWFPRSMAINGHCNFFFICNFVTLDMKHGIRKDVFNTSTVSQHRKRHLQFRQLFTDLVRCVIYGHLLKNQNRNGIKTKHPRMCWRILGWEHSWDVWYTCMDAFTMNYYRIIVIVVNEALISNRRETQRQCNK